MTFRAYAFEKLIHYYCWRWQDSNNGASQGLILRLDESTGSMPYSTLAKTFEQVYTDLDEAIRLFEESGIDREQGEVWIPNINVAHAVYARAALTKQDYAKALSEAALAEEGYPLMSNAEYTSGFAILLVNGYLEAMVVPKKTTGIGAMELNMHAMDIIPKEITLMEQVQLDVN